MIRPIMGKMHKTRGFFPQRICPIFRIALECFDIFFMDYFICIQFVNIKNQHGLRINWVYSIFWNIAHLHLHNPVEDDALAEISQA